MTQAVDPDLAFDPDPAAEIERLRREVEDLRARAQAAEALAESDVLTPALNRRGFLRELRRSLAYCRRHGSQAALLYLDLDGFKGINDRLSHAAGDAALIRTAEILTRNLRESDAVGRLGGDEFALLLLDADAAAGREKAVGLAAALESEGFDWNGEVVALHGSFGVRAFEDQADAETWLAEADAAMWVRKRGR